MRKKRIAFFIPRLGIVDRGSEVFVYELAKRLSNTFLITIFVRNYPTSTQMLFDLQKYNIEIKKINCISEKNSIVQLFYKLNFNKFLDIVRLSPFDIEMLTFSCMCLPTLLFSSFDLLFPVNGIWGVLVARFIKIIRRVPFVYTSVGGIEPIIARQNPAVYITINPEIKRWLQKHFPKLNVLFIPTGVDLKKFTPLGKKAIVKLEHPIVLTVAALVPSKAIDLTIKAVGLLKNVSLLIIGDGVLRNELQRLAEKNIPKKRFQFVSVTHDKLDQYYRAADVFAFSAPTETGWSIVHLEALGSGLKIIANKEENIEYLVGKNYPYLVDVKNEKAYAQAIQKAIHAKEKVTFKKIKEFSWDTIAEQYKKVLLQIMQ